MHPEFAGGGCTEPHRRPDFPKHFLKRCKFCQPQASKLMPKPEGPERKRNADT
jgi:hypothetical protein